jgi:DNA-binding GntR family transcriptional regulator
MPEVKVDDITNALRERILSGEFGTGGRLPSLRMFAAQYGTTRETMNKVAQRLQAEGLLSSLGTAGVFVRASRTRLLSKM